MTGRRWAWLARATASCAGGLVLLVAARRASAQSRQEIAVKAGVVVSPDTVKVADPFRVTAGVRAPRGATIEFPRTVDSTLAVQSLDPVAVRKSADTSATEMYADYRVAAWDIGSQTVRLGDVIVRYNGAERRVPLAASVFVRSILPADSAQRVPKPPRPLFEVTHFPWWLIALLVAAVAALIWLVWWWIRRRRRPPPPVVVDPFTRAKAEFQRIEALGLLDAGERGRYVALMVEVVREYLAARHPEASLSLTTTELLWAVRSIPSVPEERLMRVFTDADLIKFARRPVSTERARELGREARMIVAEEQKASRPTTTPGPVGPPRTPTAPQRGEPEVAA